MNLIFPFHIAIPVHDIDIARKFYSDILDLKEGRSGEEWVDFNFFGHQFVIHLDKDMSIKKKHFNQVDGHNVPIPHYGVVLSMKEWKILSKRLKLKKIQFIIEPYIRFKGKVGEQATMFFLDPSGNALEFKAFRNINQLFSK